MRRSLASLLLLGLLIGVPAAAQQLNILNNGGFEYGLMCFGNWVWSLTGQDYKGDYQFLLSTDAHSGSYSAEIRCAGADCDKAAIISNKIPTSGGQSYDLSLWAKCPTGRYTGIYVPGTTGGDTFQFFTCNGSWAPNRISFQFPPSVTEFVFYVYNRDIEWLRVDDIVLTYVGGDAPQQTVLHPGVRNVAVSDKAVMVDGAPYLALGFFNVGYDDLQLAADQGANTVNALASTPTADCFCTRQKNYLDRAYELGLGFVPDSTTTARLRVPEIFPAVMQRFAPHLANIAWLLADEPDQADVAFFYIPGSTLTAEYTSTKSATSLPVLADFQRAAWSSTAEVAPYVSAVDFWMAEPYGADFSGVNHAINMFNSLRPRPIWLAQDAIDASLIVPKAYWAVIGGATGIIYFDWGVFKSDPAKLAAARQAFGELKGLKSAIFGRNIDSTVIAPAGIGYIAREDQGAVYIVAANPTATLVQGKFTVPGLAAGAQVSVMFENRIITASAGEFSDSFPGVSRHVYAIQSSQSGVTVATNPAGLQIVVDGNTLTAPQTFQWAPGSQHTISTSSPQGNSSTRTVFASWSDGGAQAHSITTPSAAATYTANFTTQHYLTTAASPGAGGTISPASGFYDAGTQVPVSAAANTGYLFGGFTGDLSGATTPQTLTMNAPRSVTANFSALTSITVATNPAGLQIVVDGNTSTAPQTFQWAPGSSHTLNVVTPQTGSGVRQVFGSWSDSGANSHSITVPATATMYTASFTTQYLLTTAASTAAGGTVVATPSSADGYYNSGQSVQLAANANAAYAFANWSGDLTGTTNPGAVVLSAPRSVTANFVANNPVPAVSTLSPSSVAVGGAAFTLTVNGSWFVNGSQVRWNGSNRTTTFVNATQLQATILAADIASAVTVPVTVYTLAPGGGTSNSVNFTVGQAQPPSPVAVSPAAGSGAASTVTFTFSNPNGWQNLGVVNVLVNNYLDGRQACYLAYSQPNNLLYLMNDAGTALLPGLTVSGTGGLSNSQCTLTNPTVSGSGNTMTLTMGMSFPASFGGSKVMYLAARDVAENNSGWQRLGVWQVPGAPQTTTTAVVGMNPARGIGAGGVLTFTFTDTNGTNDLGVMNILVNDWLDGRRACYLAYVRGNNMLYLMNDNGDSLLPGMALNGSGSLGNSQCTVNGVGSSAAINGNTLTLTLNTTFGAGFAGNRVFYLGARDVSELNNTGWQAMGLWTVQ